MPKEKTVEERYKKVDQVEHILLRPDSYIGSVEHHQAQMWVWDSHSERIVNRNISYCPGLYKIFDEILVNAADNKQRDPNMSYVKVTIDAEANKIKVVNDGKSIPIEVHKEVGVYVAEMIFGQLLTSDNYDDKELRVTGGRNGFGAKLTNIFSDEFTVESGDSRKKKRFKMTWKRNMGTKSEAMISDYDKDDFVAVTFKPDLKKFGMERLDEDIVSLMTKRVYDLAGSTDKSVKVWLNHERIKIGGFADYVQLYFDKEKREEMPRIVDKSDRWEVVVSLSETGSFQQVSFVNSICTIKGGTHVGNVTDQLVNAIAAKVKTKNKGGMDIKPQHIKNHLWVFVNCLIVNPAFDSQTKETLTTKATQFGSKCSLTDKTITAVLKSGVVDSVLNWAQLKQRAELQKAMKGQGKKGTKRVIGLPKLEDANDAGGRASEHCTLILTEGDSAKTSCIAGLSVVGRDRYGVFPLKGKLLNVREAGHKQMSANAEIKAILTALGLEINKNLDSPKGLRYGSLMIMTDQDHDGSHIKGLIINMMHHYWPGLLRYPGFLKEFVTPIVKASKKKQELSFFTIPEYEHWKKQNNNGKGWKIKYYKGLGTSTDREFKEYFQAIDQHQIEFEWAGDKDGELIDMAFNKKRAEDRKVWIQNYKDGTFVDHSAASLSYSDFINKELVLFSRYDTERSVPCLCDGLKPGQRKVLFAVLKRNLRNEYKVAQLGGYVAEVSCYHHGETSLAQTIVNMAQTFVGSNNINLLEPCGQFGSRKEGGKDASAARYIFTKLSICARKLFHPSDDPLLAYQNEEGVIIEPKYYVPIIPSVLVNGAEGIGTGWSCSIPNFNPRDVILNIKRFLRGQPMERMTPWYRGFSGTIEKNAKGGFDTIGKIEKVDPETLLVTELPIRLWTQSYKEFLEGLLSGENEKEKKDDDEKGDKKKDKKKDKEADLGPVITDFRDNSGHADIHFVLKLTPERMAWAEAQGLHKVFKLVSTLNTTNMTLFTAEGKVYRYETELDIMKEFSHLRLEFYHKRKGYMMDKLERERRVLANKVKFVEMVIAQQIRISNRKKKELVGELERKGLEAMSKIQEGAITSLHEKVAQNSQVTTEHDNADNEGDDSDDDDDEASPSSSAVKASSKDYDYLLGMPLWNLTFEKVEELRRQLKVKDAELEDLRKTSVERLWDVDLDFLLEALDQQDAIDAADHKAMNKGKGKKKILLVDSPGRHKKGKGGKGGKGKAAAKKKSKFYDSGSEEESLPSEDEEEDEPGPSENSGDSSDDDVKKAKEKKKKKQQQMEMEALGKFFKTLPNPKLSTETKTVHDLPLLAAKLEGPLPSTLAPVKKEDGEGKKAKKGKDVEGQEGKQGDEDEDMGVSGEGQEEGEGKNDKGEQKSPGFLWRLKERMRKMKEEQGGDTREGSADSRDKENRPAPAVAKEKKEPVLAPRRDRPKRAVPRPKYKAALSGSSSEEDDDDDDSSPPNDDENSDDSSPPARPVKKPAAPPQQKKEAAPAKPKAQAKKPKKAKDEMDDFIVSDDDSDESAGGGDSSEDDEGDSDSDEDFVEKGGKGKGKAAAGKQKRKRGSDDDSATPPVKKKRSPPAKEKKGRGGGGKAKEKTKPKSAAKTKQVKALLHSSDENESGSSSPVRKKPAQQQQKGGGPKAKAKANGRLKKKAEDSDADSDFIDDVDAPAEKNVGGGGGGRARRAAAAAPKKYFVDSDGSGGEESDFFSD